MRVASQTVIQTVLLCLAVAATAPVSGADRFGVRNYHEVSSRLGTGGEFEPRAVKKLAKQGYEVLVDLRGDYDDEEADAAQAAGMTYVHVPTGWKKPEARSLDRLMQVMRENEGKKVLVHCAANYRASAMVYLYRVIDAGVSEADAAADVEAVWEPNDTWREFMKNSVERHRSGDSATRL